MPSLDISAYNLSRFLLVFSYWNTLPNRIVFDLDGGGWCEWDRISSAGEGRYGHVMAVYKKTLLVFGGEKREGPEYCHHVCVNETRIYYPGCPRKMERDYTESQKDHLLDINGCCVYANNNR